MKQKRIFFVLAVALLCLLCLSGCGCQHKHTHEVVTQPATCTEQGKFKVVCDDCGEIVSQNNALPAAGHSSVVTENVVSLPTCTTAGKKQVICSVCRQVVSEQDIPAKGHSDFLIPQVVSEPSCTADGVTNLICSVCGDIVYTATVVSGSHDFGAWQVLQAPTQQREGVEVRVCQSDSSHTETHALPMLSETDYTVETRAASCTQAGETVYTSKENPSLSFSVVLAKLPHTYDEANQGKCLVCGQQYYSVGLTYELSSDGTFYIVSDKNRQLRDNYVVIPDYYAGLPVKQIASEAFAYKTWVRGVTIPTTVEQIGAGAFNGCSLDKVYFNAENCQDLNGRNWAFYPTAECSQNIDVVIGNTVKRIPARLFFPLSTDTSKVPTLNSLTFEEGSICTEIGDYAFYKTAIDNVVLPDSVKTVGNYAFYGTGITRLVLGSNVESLGSFAFDSCSRLETVQFGFGLKHIGNDCFNNCRGLKNADLSLTKLETLSFDAFKGCSALENVILPASIATVGKEAFAGCTALQNVVLGAGLWQLESKAFFGCSALLEITIPQNVTDIGAGAFENCTALQKVVFEAANCNDFAQGNRTFANVAKDATLHVVFTSTVQKIPARMFYGSAEVSSLPQIGQLEIASSVKTVGSHAFFGVAVQSVQFDGQIENLTVEAGNDTLVSALGGRS